MATVDKAMLRFLKRSGHDVTIADNVGQTHHATLTRIEESASVREVGSFTFGYCKSCNWPALLAGPAAMPGGTRSRTCQSAPVKGRCASASVRTH
jgi:hypothetical protein